MPSALGPTAAVHPPHPGPSPSRDSRPWLTSTVAPMSRAASWSRSPPIGSKISSWRELERAGPRGGMRSTHLRSRCGPLPAPPLLLLRSVQAAEAHSSHRAPHRLGLGVLLGAEDPSLRTQTAGLTSHLDTRLVSNLGTSSATSVLSKTPPALKGIRKHPWRSVCLKTPFLSQHPLGS